MNVSTDYYFVSITQGPQGYIQPHYSNSAFNRIKKDIPRVRGIWGSSYILGIL